MQLLPRQCALFELGFRPFFLLASLFSILSMLGWVMVYSFGWRLPVLVVNPIAWHGHDMVFGYTTAVIAGFLLTAVRNWTGIHTLRGLPLCLLAIIWLVARVLPLLGSALFFKWAALFDIAFLLLLAVAVAYPIIKTKKWPQLMIVFILLLLTMANIVYYLGAFGVLNQGVSWGLYSGVYLVMLLTTIIAGRVVPFFVDRAIGYQGRPVNWPLIEKIHLPLLLVLWLMDVFFKQIWVTGLLAFTLALLHGLRLYRWYVKGIWQKPLLWSLLIAYGFLVVSFLLKALGVFTFYPSSYSLHAFAYGGIGMMTIAMMARVSLGHTGRNVNQPPASLVWVFIMLFFGAVIRALLPFLFADYYGYLIAGSQFLWIGAFSLFFIHFLPIFMQPRVDAKQA